MADSSPPPTVQPQINDAYWFAFSKTLVDGALKSRDDAADKLQGFVGWLWTIYTAGAVIGINLGKLSLGFWPSLLVGSPVVALVGVYWMTIWVRTPEVTAFDARVPKQIEYAYERNLKEKQRKLLITLICTAIAGALTASAIGYASVASSAAQTPRLNVQIAGELESRTIFVSGNAPDAPNVVLSVYGYEGKQRGALLSREEVPTDKGQFRGAPLHVNGSVPKTVFAEVAAELKESGAKMILSKEVSLDAPVKL